MVQFSTLVLALAGAAAVSARPIAPVEQRAQKGQSVSAMWALPGGLEGLKAGAKPVKVAVQNARRHFGGQQPHGGFGGQGGKGGFGGKGGKGQSTATTTTAAADTTTVAVGTSTDDSTTDASETTTTEAVDTTSTTTTADATSTTDTAQLADTTDTGIKDVVEMCQNPDGKTSCFLLLANSLGSCFTIPRPIGNDVHFFVVPPGDTCSLFTDLACTSKPTAANGVVSASSQLGFSCATTATATSVAADTTTTDTTTTNAADTSTDAAETSTTDASETTTTDASETTTTDAADTTTTNAADTTTTDAAATTTTTTTAAGTGKGKGHHHHAGGNGAASSTAAASTTTKAAAGSGKGGKASTTAASTTKAASGAGKGGKASTTAASTTTKAAAGSGKGGKASTTAASTTKAASGAGKGGKGSKTTSSSAAASTPPPPSGGGAANTGSLATTGGGADTGIVNVIAACTGTDSKTGCFEVLGDVDGHCFTVPPHLVGDVNSFVQSPNATCQVFTDLDCTQGAAPAEGVLKNAKSILAWSCLANSAAPPPVASSSAADSSSSAADSSSSVAASTTESSAAAAGTGAAGTSFGKCTAPQIEFAANVPGSAKGETRFIATDQKSFPHEGALNIAVITQATCDTLVNSCGVKSGDAGHTLCVSAQAAASKVPANGTGAPADAFNKVMGFKTNFAAVKATK